MPASAFRKLLYKVNSDWMKPHLPGSQSGRSVFSPNVNAEVAVLDAAQFADENGLWDMLKPNRAVVQMSGIVGTTDTGQDTQWIAVSRRKSGWIHGWPEEAPSG